MGTKRLALVALLLSLSGCDVPAPPPEKELLQGMTDALIDTGFYTQVAINRVVGKHHNKAANTWKVLACYQFAAPDETQGTNCIDSFTAFRLDNGTWVIAVTVNEVYRWRALGRLPVAPASEAVSTPTAAEAES